jgi:tagatose-6-phosphate ketose/aldose isomerase
MKNLLLEVTALNYAEITNTEKEIWNQPMLWKKIYNQVITEKESLVAFLNIVTSLEHLNIVLTGAGTSAFIGLSLSGTYNRNFKKHTTAISTTDLVTHPLDYLNPDNPLFIISFARSGNSPESVAAVRIADQICSNVYHLIITCDATGDLAKYDSYSSKYVFVLPEEANDKSLAMTSSYSGMLLAGVLIAKVNEIESLKSQLNILVRYGHKLLKQSEKFRKIAKLNFERAVFLGSGPLNGTATESHLKLQELTDGKIICKNDSFLGFRHGPKAVINNKTLVFLLFSNQKYVLPYETDLIDSLNDGQQALYTAGLIESGSLEAQLDEVFVLSDDGNLLEEEFLPVCFILPAQMIGFHKSIQLGLNPDSPSLSGAINRVVKGVTIYPFNKQD